MLASLRVAPGGGLIGAAARIARASFASSAEAAGSSPGGAGGVVEIATDADFASVVDKLAGEEKEGALKRAAAVCGGMPVCVAWLWRGSQATRRKMTAAARCRTTVERRRSPH